MYRERRKTFKGPQGRSWTWPPNVGRLRNLVSYLLPCLDLFLWWGKFVLQIIYTVQNPNLSCVLADEGQAWVFMWTWSQAGFRMGFLLTHRLSLHKAHSAVKQPILLFVLSQAVNSQYPHWWKLHHLPSCIHLSYPRHVNICSDGPQRTTSYLKRLCSWVTMKKEREKKTSIYSSTQRCSALSI